jgi:hypothetical protein
LADEKPKASAGKASASAMDAHLHRIDLEELIVHRYSEHEALFKRADKAARALIEGELREGEGMRVVKPGVYQVFFPKLTPDAGALRCSVIAEQVAREVRDINPTSRSVDRQREEPATRGPKRVPGTANREPPAGAGHHEAGTRAIALMAEAKATEDISLTSHDKETLGALRPAFHPVWHTKNNLITGYYCTLTNPGAPTIMRSLHELLNQSSEEIAGAKVDATLYRHAAEAVQYLLKLFDG